MFLKIVFRILTQDLRKLSTFAIQYTGLCLQIRFLWCLRIEKVFCRKSIHLKSDSQFDVNYLVLNLLLNKRFCDSENFLWDLYEFIALKLNLQIVIRMSFFKRLYLYVTWCFSYTVHYMFFCSFSVLTVLWHGSFFPCLFSWYFKYLLYLDGHHFSRFGTFSASVLLIRL